MIGNRPLLLAIACLPLLTAAGSNRFYGVKEVIERHDELDGRRILVRGWLSYCLPLNCVLYASNDLDSDTLSIGSSRSFDKVAKRLSGKKIEILAKLDADCSYHVADRPDDKASPNEDGVSEDGHYHSICLDRADVLSKPRLVRVLR
jgi:hypothetical protein